jgi:mannose-6-phosphate isomerase-like protein (cupin superfamily)
MKVATKTVRRLVSVDGADGKSRAAHDGPAPDVRVDPARPGFSAVRLWVTDATPAPVALRDTSQFAQSLEPPRAGSVLRIVTFPPEREYLRNIGSGEVRAYFTAMGSPGASAYSARSPHPYMQKTRTLEFCLVLEGKITLVLDTDEVQLKQGDTVVQRGTRHAWSNRSDRPCVVAISSHDALG